jgi:AbiV family abortive infection protein
MSEVDSELQAQRDRDVEAMRACVKHARDLVNSARAVFDIKHPNIAFHLALLALEELGRRELIGLQRVAETNGKERPWHKHTLLHAKKIFWCFFGAEFVSGHLEKGQLDSIKQLSETLHSQRMAGLYVDYQDENLSIPAEAIDPTYCASLLDLADARVQMAEAEKLRENIAQEDLDLQAWFLTFTAKKENTQMMFSKTSIAKLSEMNDARAWILWLRSEVEAAEAHTKAMLEQELKRSQSLPKEGTKDKWRLKIRIVSQSHSVRQKPLNEWNKAYNWIKLSAVSGKPNELLIEFTLKDNTPIEALWWFGWGLSRHFVAALNIATRGFWWWHMPEDIDSYFESIDEIETNSRLGIRRTPSLKVDWGANRVFNEQDISLLSQCFATLPFKRERHEPYNHYIAGLTFLSLNDVHWQCEIQSFGHFFESIKAMMVDVGDLQPSNEVLLTLRAFLMDLFPAMAPEQLDHFNRIFEACGAKDFTNVPVNLSDVSFMKIFCDSYFLTRVIPATVRRRRTEGNPAEHGEVHQ